MVSVFNFLEQHVGFPIIYESANDFAQKKCYVMNALGKTIFIYLKKGDQVVTHQVFEDSALSMDEAKKVMDSVRPNIHRELLACELEGRIYPEHYTYSVDLANFIVDVTIRFDVKAHLPPKTSKFKDFRWCEKVPYERRHPKWGTDDMWACVSLIFKPNN